jgi:hypothetical protein
MSKYFYSGGKSLKGGATSTEYDASTDITVRGGSFNGNITQSSGTANLQAVSCSSLTATGAVSGTTLSGSLSTASQPNITSLGTLTSLTASGAISGATLGGSLTTASQGNITTVGTLGTLSVSGNVTSGNISATRVTATLVSGSLTTASQGNITTVGTLGSLTVSGNVTCSGTLTVDSLEVHPVQGTTTSFSGVTTHNITIPTGRRVLSIVILNLTASTMPFLFMYGSSGTGNQTWEGYTNGNAGGAQLTWGSSVSLYNTTWSSSYNMNVNIDVIQISSTVYMIRGHGDRLDGSTGYYVHYYGKVTFTNSATLSYLYLSGNSMSCDSITYASYN